VGTTLLGTGAMAGCLARGEGAGTTDGTEAKSTGRLDDWLADVEAGAA
jgi:hypothetical protein